MSLFPKKPKPKEHVHTVAQEMLLLCSAYGCNEQANSQNAVITGVLGIGKAWVYFCEDHERDRLIWLASSNQRRKKKEEQSG